MSPSMSAAIGGVVDFTTTTTSAWALGSSWDGNATIWSARPVNDTANPFDVDGEPDTRNNWWALLALFLVVATAAGNILVCLAITWERRLQNVTNYFLMSLAITDLMVAVLVMPVGILTLFKGESIFIRPFGRWSCSNPPACTCGLCRCRGCEESHKEHPLCTLRLLHHLPAAGLRVTGAPSRALPRALALAVLSQA